MKINVIGLGYIGLPTALIMASNELEVVGTDYNTELIEKLNEGKITFEEDGLEILFKEAINKGIKFTTEYQSTDVYIVAVPTPYDNITKKIDPQYVCAAVEKVVDVCNKGAIIIIESTIAPGTIDKYIKPIIEKKGLKIGKDIDLAHAPERIIPGNMIYELRHNSRTIGAYKKEIGEKVAQIYRKITKGDVIVTDIKTAEMTKVIENTYRAVNIAFANELAQICNHNNMNVYEIIRICNMHPRVNILNPGPGVGGHCIPIDPWFLVGENPTLTTLISEALNINASMPEYVIKRIKEIMDEKNINDYKKVGLYGLTYKENVDDYRESPTLQLLKNEKYNLLGKIKIYDPYIKKDIIENQYHSLDKFLEDVEMVVIMVKHNEIKLNINKLNGKIVLDTQNICNKANNIYKL